MVVSFVDGVVAHFFLSVGKRSRISRVDRHRGFAKQRVWRLIRGCECDRISTSLQSFRILRLILTFILSSATLLPAAILAGCGDDDGSAPAAGVTVLATTTQLADLAGNVAGDRAQVVGLLAPGSDPHDYEPRPSDAEAMIDASLIVESGGDLDIWADELVESSGTDGEVITILDSVETIERGHEEDEHAEDEHAEEGIDPHWWQDPANAVIAVEQIRGGLAAADPDGAGEYEENASAYIERIEQLDQAIGDCLGQIPDDERKLVTTHDALGYFAERYEIEVVGAAIPALTTQAQPSAGDTAELVGLIESEGVNAVFPEAGLNPDLEEAIADEAGATVGGELHADTLGGEGSGAETWLEALASNARAMAAGFSAGEVTCNDLPSG